MARLGRTQPGYRSGHSTLGPPKVVGPVQVYGPVGTHYDVAVKAANDGRVRRAPASVLRPPVVVSAAVQPPVQTTLQVNLAPSRDVPRRFAKSALHPPTVVGPVQVYGPIVVSRADAHRPAPTRSILRPPTVVTAAAAADVFPGPRVELARAKQDLRRQPKSDIAGPTVVTSSTTQFGGTGISLADPRNARSDGRRAAHSHLSPPATVTAAGFVADAVRVYRTEPHRPAQTKTQVRPPTAVGPVQVYPGPRVISRTQSHRPAPTHARLAPPTVVGPVVLYGPIQVELAKVRQARATGHSKLSPPAVVTAVSTFIAEPVRVTRADSHRPAATRTRLAAPTVVGPVQLYGPVDVQFAKVRQARPLGHWRLAAPAVVGPVQVYGPVDVQLGKVRQARPLGHWHLAPPTVVTVFPPVDTTVQVSLTRAPNARQHFAKSRLAPPAVVGPVQVYPSVTTSLAPAPRQARAPKSVLRAPAVVAPLFTPAPVQTALAPSSKLARRSHSKLSAPAVVAPQQLYGPLTTQFAPQAKQPRATHSRLRPPTVIGAAVIFRPLDVTLSGRTRLEMQRHGSHFRLRPPQVVTETSFTEPFDQPTPTGRTSSVPTAGDYDHPTPTGRTSSTPTEGRFDIPIPIGRVDIPDPED